MSLSGNFGSVTLEGDQLRALGDSVEVDGSEAASLHVAIFQNGKVAQGPAQISGAGWVTDPLLSAPDFVEGDALGLACQTLVTVSDGTLPSFTTFTWSEQITIAGPGE